MFEKRLSSGKKLRIRQQHSAPAGKAGLGPKRNQHHAVPEIDHHGGKPVAA